MRWPARCGLVVAVVCVSDTLVAQTTAPPLTDFVGTYQDAPGHTMEIVAGESLFAVLDDSKYALKRAAGDVFVAASGDTIPFQRDGAGQVVGYVQRGAMHPRLTTKITASSAALAWPRGSGPVDPGTYQYRVPTTRSDGIPVGDISASDLDTATATA